MKGYLFILIICFMNPFFGNSSDEKEEYCLTFSKKNKKTLMIKKGKKISYVLNKDRNWSDEQAWNEGILEKITSDSLFIKSYIEESLFSEEENNFNLIGYDIQDFKMIAYAKTSRIAGGSAKLILIVSVFTASCGTLMLPIVKNEDGVPIKLFKKNIDFDKGWVIDIVKC